MSDLNQTRLEQIDSEEFIPDSLWGGPAPAGSLNSRGDTASKD